MNNSIDTDYQDFMKIYRRPTSTDHWYHITDWWATTMESKLDDKIKANQSNLNLTQLNQYNLHQESGKVNMFTSGELENINNWPTKV